jgi:uncharacterized protein (DUF697 family)/predicted GTPase
VDRQNGYDEQQQFEADYEEQLRGMGRVNVLVVGATGAGKSTLINAVFSGDVCQTGIGLPVTEDTTYYQHPTGTAGFFDTRGIEFGDGRSRVLKWLHKEVQERRNKSVDEHIHVAWYCVRSTDLRLDPAQMDFIRELDKMGIPVVMVLTKVARLASTGEVDPQTRQFAAYLANQDLPVVGGAPILTAALADGFFGCEPHGLEELLDVTASAVPAEVLGALHTAQRLNFKVKRENARSVIHLAAAAAGATGFIPVPGADLVLLIPIETKMVARLSAIYGLPLQTRDLLALVTPIVLGGGLVKVASTFLRSALKAVPGSEFFIGPISATISVALTESIGWGWVGVCEYILQNDPTGKNMPSAQYLRSLFRQSLKLRKSGGATTSLRAA